MPYSPRLEAKSFVGRREIDHSNVQHIHAGSRARSQTAREPVVTAGAEAPSLFYARNVRQEYTCRPSAVLSSLWRVHYVKFIDTPSGSSLIYERRKAALVTGRSDPLSRIFSDYSFPSTAYSWRCLFPVSPRSLLTWYYFGSRLRTAAVPEGTLCPREFSLASWKQKPRTSAAIFFPANSQSYMYLYSIYLIPRSVTRCPRSLDINVSLSRAELINSARTHTRPKGYSSRLFTYSLPLLPLSLSLSLSFPLGTLFSYL